MAKPTKPPPKRFRSGVQRAIELPTVSDYVRQRIRELGPDHGWDPEAIEKIVAGEAQDVSQGRIKSR